MSSSKSEREVSMLCEMLLQLLHNRDGITLLLIPIATPILGVCI